MCWAPAQGGVCPATVPCLKGNSGAVTCVPEGADLNPPPARRRWTPRPPAPARRREACGERRCQPGPPRPRRTGNQAGGPRPAAPLTAAAPRPAPPPRMRPGMLKYQRAGRDPSADGPRKKSPAPPNPCFPSQPLRAAGDRERGRGAGGTRRRPRHRTQKSGASPAAALSPSAVVLNGAREAGTG